MREAMRKSFRSSLERQARRHTQSLSKRSPGARLELEVWGRMKITAYENIGWEPGKERLEDGVDIATLYIQAWDPP